MKQDQINRLSLALSAWMGTLLMLPVQVVYLSISAPISAQQPAAQLSPAQLKQLAQSITVKIVSKDNGGSGILIRKEGQFYTVVTNKHVLEPGKPARIQTPDGKTYQANLLSNVNFQGKDLALLQFRADGKYAVASLGNLATVAVNDQLFAAGFPFEADPSQSKGFVFTKGQVLYVPERAFKEGYQIGYSNEIEKGMSGGPILNRQGKVIGINGIHAYPLWGNPYVYEDNSQPTPAQRDLMSRYSWGIPLQTFARLAPRYTSPDALPQANSPSTQTLPAIANDVNNTAQEITVRIDVPSAPNCSGSGVIIAKQGNTYTVLTAEHVVRQQEKCDRTSLEVVTPDSQRHAVNNSTVKPVQEADLAVLQFTSNQNYRVATLAKYDLVETKGFVFVPGWAEDRAGVTKRRLFTAGQVLDRQFGSLLTNSSLSLNYGYGLVYSNLTEAGMSGGPVLDTRGRVIGIHGRAEVEEIKDKAGQTRLLTLGFSLGVPVSTFLSQAQVVGIKPELLRVETSPPPPLTQEEKNSISKVLLKVEKPSDSADAIDWANYGWQLWRVGEHREQGLKALDRAIELKPNFYQAWYLRGFLQINKNDKYQETIKSWDKATQIEPGFSPPWRLRGLFFLSSERPQEALESFDQVIKLDPNDLSAQIWRSMTLSILKRFPEALDASNRVLKSNPVSWAYLARGEARMGQKDLNGALADLNEAIRRNPEYIEATAYYLRGSIRSAQKDFKGALADLNEAVRLKPEDVNYTKLRGNVRIQLQDFKGAIADYTEAIRMKPDDADAYSYRGVARIGQKDSKGALADLNEAIRLKPDYADAFLVRGLAYTQLKDYKGAIADYTQMLRLKPDYADAYYYRGLAYTQLKDYKGARQDFQQAADLSKQQGKTDDYQKALARIKELQ